MEQREYDKATASAVFELAGMAEAWNLRDNGVFVEEEYRLVSPSGCAFDWTPAYEMDWAGASNPMTAPALPIPFTANELAACLLDGLGSSIQDSLGTRIGHALDDEKLSLFTNYGRWAHDAVRDAYALARAAQTEIGDYDYDESLKAAALTSLAATKEDEANQREGVFENGIGRDEANRRRERAKASVSDLCSKAERARAESQSKWFAWRKAMVSQLLRPQPASSQSLAAPVLSASGGMSWTLKLKPRRLQGYGKPLYDLLRAAHIAGKLRPTARDVLESWREKAPLQIAKLLADSLDYYDSDGNTKTASLEAIRKTIGRMTS